MDLSFVLELLSIKTLIICMVGTLVGIVLGSIPGMNGGIGVAVLLPLTYSMEPASALLFLGGIYMGSSYGGSISGILINCPGTVESACTSIEGYAMAKKGKAKKALLYSVNSSVIGGIIGVIALIFFTPILARISVKFGPPEMFLVAICGITIVGSLSGDNLLKGIFAGLFGIFIGMIGVDSISGAVRFTYGSKLLLGGVNLIPAVIGFFAVTEMIKQTNRIKNSENNNVNITLEKASAKEVFKDIFKNHKRLIGKSSIIGTIIGLIPGTGGAISSFLAYGEAKRTSKSGKKFGEGNPEGIIAAESANNSAVGGALVPMLALGIPGSSTTAIMYGALLIHGLTPGPSLFTDHADIAYTFLFGMALTVLFMFIFGVYGVQLFSNILKVNLEYIIPVVLVCSVIGAYSVRNSITDVIIAVIFGLIGLIFSKLKIPAAPVILGLILGGTIESNLMRCLVITESHNTNLISYILSRPLCIGILIIAIYLIYTNFKTINKKLA